MPGFIDPLETASGELEEAVAPEPAGPDPETLDLVRELVLRAHPDVVPELVRGASLPDLLASVAPAHQAYTDLVARLHVDGAPPTHQVPAGGAAPAPLDFDRIPTSEKLRRGIRDRLIPSLR